MYLRRLSIAAALFAASLAASCGEKTAPAEPVTKIERPSSELPVMGPERRILAFGDSLFAGYNVAAADSYPAKLEAALRAQGINAKVTNAGVSGDTTAAGLQRLTFILDAQAGKPDLFILELGGNDLLRQLQPDQTRANLDAILAELKKREIPVVLMGMRAPPNNGAEYQAEFDGIYPALAKQYDVALVPFFMEAIYNKPQLIQRDRIHPTEAGIEALVGATAGAVKDALPKQEAE